MHEITRENFFHASGTPAGWHELSVFNKFDENGLQIEREDRDYTAVETYGLFGKPQYSLTPLECLDPEGNPVPYDDYMIWRHPVYDDPKYRMIGRASENYQLIQGATVAADWDQHIQLPVETMMLLRKDGVLVITAKMPDYDVKGDSIRNFLILTNGMDGKTGIRADVSGVRVVCANTLRMAQSRTIHHTTGSYDRLIIWMQDVVDRARFQTQVMNETYNILAESKIDTEQVRWIANTVYRDPAKPDPNFMYKDGLQAAQVVYERNVENTQIKRDALVKLFTQNTAIGFEDSPLQGTAWHALNAATQMLTHGRTSSFRSRTESLLIGDRAETIERVTDQILGWYPEAQDAANREYEKVLV